MTNLIQIIRNIDNANMGVQEFVFLAVVLIVVICICSELPKIKEA